MDIQGKLHKGEEEAQEIIPDPNTIHLPEPVQVKQITPEPLLSTESQDSIEKWLDQVPDHASDTDSDHQSDDFDFPNRLAHESSPIDMDDIQTLFGDHTSPNNFKYAEEHAPSHATMIQYQSPTIIIPEQITTPNAYPANLIIDSPLPTYNNPPTEHIDDMTSLDELEIVETDLKRPRETTLIGRMDCGFQRY